MPFVMRNGTKASIEGILQLHEDDKGNAFTNLKEKADRGAIPELYIGKS
jgi:hypothetical protein